MRRGQRKTAVEQVEKRAEAHQPVPAVARLRERRAAAPAPVADPGPVATSPLFGVALLKTALELKRQRDATVEEVLSGVLARMRIPEEEFRRFLVQNGGLLRAIAEKRGG